MNSEQVSNIPIIYDNVDIQNPLRKLRPSTEINDDIINGPSPHDQQLDSFAYAKVMVPISSPGHWSFAVILNGIEV
jgi:predicted transcriptional regulator